MKKQMAVITGKEHTQMEEKMASVEKCLQDLRKIKIQIRVGKKSLEIPIYWGTEFVWLIDGYTMATFLPEEYTSQFLVACQIRDETDGSTVELFRLRDLIPKEDLYVSGLILHCLTKNNANEN